MAEDVGAFWAQARPALGLPVDASVPEAWAFGDGPEMADDLLALVLAGTKTATAGALWAYEAEDEPLPTEGGLSIVLDGAGHPQCVIETTEVRVVPMDQVDPAFAYEEGEGDRTWAWWRNAHETFFRRTLPADGHAFEPSMPLVLERFRLLYPTADSAT